MRVTSGRHRRRSSTRDYSRQLRRRRMQCSTGDADHEPPRACPRGQREREVWLSFPRRHQFKFQFYLKKCTVLRMRFGTMEKPKATLHAEARVQGEKHTNSLSDSPSKGNACCLGTCGSVAPQRGQARCSSSVVQLIKHTQSSATKQLSFD